MYHPSCSVQRFGGSNLRIHLSQSSVLLKLNFSGSWIPDEAAIVGTNTTFRKLVTDTSLWVQIQHLGMLVTDTSLMLKDLQLSNLGNETLVIADYNYVKIFKFAMLDIKL